MVVKEWSVKGYMPDVRAIQKETGEKLERLIYQGTDVKQGGEEIRSSTSKQSAQVAKAIQRKWGKTSTGT